MVPVQGHASLTACLQLSVGSGDVVLENLVLKSDALADLDLPITVKVPRCSSFSSACSSAYRVLLHWRLTDCHQGWISWSIEPYHSVEPHQEPPSCDPTRGTVTVLAPVAHGWFRSAYSWSLAPRAVATLTKLRNGVSSTLPALMPASLMMHADTLNGSEWRLQKCSQAAAMNRKTCDVSPKRSTFSDRYLSG
jgi:hypothetical protein